MVWLCNFNRSYGVVALWPLPSVCLRLEMVHRMDHHTPHFSPLLLPIV